MHAFGAGGGDILADKISFDWELTVAAVNKHGELDSFRSAEIIEGIHGRPDCASAKEHVIYEHDSFACDVKGDNGGKNIGGCALVEVVAVHADIEAAGEDRLSPDAGEDDAQTLCEGHPTPLDSYQCDFAAGFVSFGNFVCDAGKGTIEGGGIEDEGRFRHAFLGHLAGWR